MKVYEAENRFEMRTTDLGKTELTQNEYSIGITFAENQFGLLIVAEEQEIFCLECFRKLLENYEVFPNHNEDPVVILLKQPFMCANCGNTIYPAGMLIEIENDEAKRNETER